MGRVNLMDKEMRGKGFSTHFTIAAPDYFVRRGLFKPRLRSRIDGLLTTYLDQVKRIALSAYGKWLKPEQVNTRVYHRDAADAEVGRFNVVNPLFLFVEYPTKPHFPPLLRAEGPVVGPRRRRTAKKTSETLTDARVLGVNTLSKRQARGPKKEKVYLANSGITRWVNERPFNPGYGHDAPITPFLVARKISLVGTVGRFVVTDTIRKIADVLQREFITAVLAIFNGYER